MQPPSKPSPRDRSIIVELTDTNDAVPMANNLNVWAHQSVEKFEAKSGDAGFAAFRKKMAKKRTEATDDTDKQEAESLRVGMKVKSKKSGKTGTIRFHWAHRATSKDFGAA